MCYLPLCVVTTTFVWTILVEAMHVIFCCVFLANLGLLPIDLGLTRTLSLHSGRTIDTSDTYTHQACEPHFLKTKQITLLC